MAAAKIMHDLPFADYLNIEAASSSVLRDLAAGISPAKVRGRRDVDTTAKRRGTLLHAMVLEPDSVAERFVEAPAVNLATNAGRRERIGWMLDACGLAFSEIEKKTGIEFSDVGRGQGQIAEGVALGRWTDAIQPSFDALGLTVVTAADMNVCTDMREALMARPDIRAALEAPMICEASIIGERDGIKTKIRPDGWQEASRLVDLKKVRDVSRRGVRRNCNAYGYDVQAGWYTECIKQATGENHDWLWIAIEDDPPYDCCLYAPDESDMLWGLEQALRGFDLYRRCIESGVWPGQGWDWDRGEYAIQTLSDEETEAIISEST